MGGCCSSSPDRSLDQKVGRELDTDRQKDSKTHKLLFLGSGGSGKSTFFKQLKCIHGKGFSVKDRMVFKEHIGSQMIEQMNRCVECIEFYNEKLPPHFEPISLSSEAMESAKYMDSMSSEYVLNSEIGKAISILWKEDAIKHIYSNRAIYHIDDSSSHFFESISRISQSDYEPTDSDILLVRYRTTGVIENELSIMGSSFHIFDVGGQQSERKKWIHCFENVTAVIFVASLSCYDELMFEDDSMNAMQDSITLFDEICNLQWFITTPIILFLNKSDLFREKIQIVPLNVCFSNFNSILMNQDDMDESNDEYIDECCNFIKTQFTQKNHNSQTRQIYIHVTCATNKQNVQNVFNDVQQIVVAAGLSRNNLI